MTTMQVTRSKAKQTSTSSHLLPPSSFMLLFREKKIFEPGKPFAPSHRLISEARRKRCAGHSLRRGGRAGRRFTKGNDAVNAGLFQTEVRRIERLLYHIAWSHLGSGPDAEDAVQDALIKAWEKRDTLRDESQFKPWLTRILANQCKDMLRKRKRYSFYPLKEDTAQVSPPEAENPVLAAMETLRPEYRLVMTLYYLDGYSMRETAELLGIPLNTVKTRMRNARKRLGQTLLIEWEETP